MKPDLRGCCHALAALICAALFPMLPCRAADAMPPVRTAQVPDTLAQRLKPCMACHGAEGKASREGYLPRIAGKPAGYLYHQLLNFRDGRRSNPAMAQMLAHQSDAYLLEIARYFAALNLPYAAVPALKSTPADLARGEALVQRGDPKYKLPACIQCHGTALTGRQPAIPGLLGLPRDYLVAQLGAWQTGIRHAIAPDCMAEITQRLGPGDISAVASWLALQPVPALAHAEPPTAKPAPLPCGSAAPTP
jgi:cytochrome c553